MIPKALTSSLSLLLLLSCSATIAWSYNSKLQKCLSQCRQQQSYRQREQCESECQYKYSEGGADEPNRDEGGNRGSGRWESEGQGEGGENPYLFDRESFSTPLKSEDGYLKVLQRFSEKSKLLRGLENYRLAILKANPNTFVLPNHWDAESIFFVISGSGIISMLTDNDNKESYTVKRGDVLRVDAGTPVYIINRDSKEELYIAKLLRPVASPDHFQAFFGSGGEDPESFYRSFSLDLLEAALKASRENIQKLFTQYDKGAIRRISPEQAKELSKHASSASKGSRSIFGGESKSSRSFNLFENNKPLHSNQHGEIYEACPKDHSLLRDMDAGVGFSKIKRGSMTAPSFNSRASKVILVVDGNGYFEMACPHMSQNRSGSYEGESEQESVSYTKMNGPLEHGNVVVVPAGHPFTAVASQNEDLLLLCFDLNADGNVKYYLAGKNTYWNKLEDLEKELSFDAPAKLVNRVFGAQKEVGLLPGPEQSQGQDRSGSSGDVHSM